MIRRFIGWLIALGFTIVGARRRKLRLYDDNEKILSLVGHDPTPDDFEQLMIWFIKHGFTFISTDDILNKKLPKGRKAWLTFDDGWIGFKALLPILERYNIPVTLFIAPHETERGQLWPDSIMAITPHSEIREMYSMDLPNREKIVDAILKTIGNPRRLMTESELKEISKNSLITLENHTWSHLSCSHRPVDEVIEEVRMTSSILTEWTNRVCRLVCFPYGHYNDEVKQAIIKEGLYPVTCDAGEMSIGAIGLKRNMFREHVSLSENICRCMNSWLKVVTPDK